MTESADEESPRPEAADKKSVLAAAETPVVTERMIAYARVQVPSIGLLFFGMLGVFTILIFALDPMGRLDGRATRAEQKEEAAASGVETPTGTRTGDQAAEAVPEEGSRIAEIIPPRVRWAIGALCVFAGIMICVGAWNMRYLKNLKLARLGCLLAVLPLNPLFCLSFVFGVWGAVVMFREDVEEHFAN